MATLFGARLEEHASRDAALAVILPGLEMSYSELLARVRACATQVARARLLPSETVGITIADELAHFVSSLALLSLGVPQIGLPTYEPIPKRLDLARRLAVTRVIVADPRHALPGLQALPVAVDAPDAGARRAPKPVTSDPDVPGIWYASSGTTGEPKIYALTQRMLAWRGAHIIRSEGGGAEYRTFSPVSIEDPLSKNRRTYCAWAGHASVFQSRTPSPPRSLQEQCTSLGVTCVELTILQVSDLLADRSDMRRLPARTTVYTTGAMVSPRMRSEFEARFGVPLLVHYGAREFGRISADTPGSGDYDTEATGPPVPWIELEIVDGEGRTVPKGEVGEIRVRSEHMIRAYHADPVATSRHLRDGWFYPGDMGSLTPRGGLRVHGRGDDMMNLNGIKIFPAEIERVLEDHPAVKAAAAFPKSSLIHGDIPIAAVELHEAGSIGAEELMSRARERLGLRAPRKIIVLASLPRNAAGKVVKRELASFVTTGT